jgi:hypothetical protein
MGVERHRTRHLTATKEPAKLVGSHLRMMARPTITFDLLLVCWASADERRKSFEIIRAEEADWRWLS